MSLLSIRDLDIRHGLLQAVRDVTFHVEQGETVALIPTMHQFQADDFYQQSPILRSHKIKFVEFQPGLPQKYLIAYRRLADWPDAVAALSSRVDLLESTKRGGHTIAFFAQVRSE